MPELLTPGVGGGPEEEKPGFRGLIPLAAITAPKWNLKPKMVYVTPEKMIETKIGPYLRVEGPTKATMVLPTDTLHAPATDITYPVEVAAAHEGSHLADWNMAPTFMRRQWDNPWGRGGIAHEPDLRRLLTELRSGMAEVGAGVKGAGRNLQAYSQLPQGKFVWNVARRLYPDIPDPVNELVKAANTDPAALHEKVLGLLRASRFPSKIANILRQTIPQMIAKGVRTPTDLALNLIPQSFLERMLQQAQGPQG